MKHKIITSIEGINIEFLRGRVTMERVVGVATVGVCAQGIWDFYGATFRAGLLRRTVMIYTKKEEEMAEEEAWHYVWLSDHFA